MRHALVGLRGMWRAKDNVTGRCRLLMRMILLFLMIIRSVRRCRVLVIIFSRLGAVTASLCLLGAEVVLRKGILRAVVVVWEGVRRNMRLGRLQLLRVLQDMTRLVVIECVQVVTLLVILFVLVSASVPGLVLLSGLVIALAVLS